MACCAADHLGLSHVRSNVTLNPFSPLMSTEGAKAPRRDVESGSGMAKRPAPVPCPSLRKGCLLPFIPALDLILQPCTRCLQTECAIDEVCKLLSCCGSLRTPPPHTSNPAISLGICMGFLPCWGALLCLGSPVHFFF